MACSFNRFDFCGAWRVNKPPPCLSTPEMAAYSLASRAFLSRVAALLSDLLGPPSVEQLRHETSRSAGALPECSCCLCFMVSPVCLPCGHSLCKTCLERGSGRPSAGATLCPECKQSWPLVPPGMSELRKPTLVLQNAFRTMYPRWAECWEDKEKGNVHAREGKFELAVRWYTKAIETGK